MKYFKMFKDKCEWFEITRAEAIHTLDGTYREEVVPEMLHYMETHPCHDVKCMFSFLRAEEDD